jgi:hypothetical protein
MQKVSATRRTGRYFLHDRGSELAGLSTGTAFGMRPAGQIRHHHRMSDWPSGIFTWESALREYGRSRVQRWIRTGCWVRQAAGIYASIDSPVDPFMRIRFASQSAGPGHVVVGESAALIHGFGVLDHDVVQLAGGPSKTARIRPGVQIHGYRIPPRNLMRIGELVVTTPERTVVDLARAADRIDGLAVVDAALRKGVCTAETLAGQLKLQAGSRGIIQARQLVEWGDAGAESPMESRARFRVLDSDLPRPVLQFWVCDKLDNRVYRLDLAWPDYRVGLEYDGIGHLDRARQRHDLERRAWLSDAGWRILYVTDIDIYRQQARMLTRLDRQIRRDHAESIGDTPYGTILSA